MKISKSLSKCEFEKPEVKFLGHIPYCTTRPRKGPCGTPKPPVEKLSTGARMWHLMGARGGLYGGPQNGTLYGGP
eukprot:758133-Pelagomonas_calceolata.AAC.1